MKKLSIGLRLTLWYVAIFALAQLIFGAGMWFTLHQKLYDIVDDSLESQADDLKNFMAAQKKDASVAKLQEEAAEAFDLEHSGNYLQIYLGYGVWIYRSPFLQANPLPTFEPNTISQPFFENRHLGYKPYRFMVERLEVNGRVYTVETGLLIDDVVGILHKFRSYLLMFAPLVLLLAASGGYWLSRKALSPMDALVRTARAISGANLSSRLEKLNTGDELQRLSDTLNEMLDRIETAFLRITEFTADASHELRTPISLVRTEAELALRRSRGEPEYREALRHILLEAERTTSLIEQLLSLARADSGRETLNLRPVDLRETLRGVVEGWRHVASIRNLQFTANIEERELFVLGDETALRRVVDILLDNAFKYTPTPGTVELCLKQSGENAMISVQDSGVGIAEPEQDKIFERFYRVDKARSRALGGAGLGLAIARWIVSQHRGAVAVESNVGKGSTFRVELPLAPAAVKNALPIEP
ncbi:MAG TPA: ATP-binding protein [Candidatus Sulfotelmatobacter sp.]|nr:ATP-binding protein [Candidatus Sulfotelmatobacter sp.]